jgi:UDP:flavonoid glycosyltransferase YjiC (YdhE family)
VLPLSNASGRRKQVRVHELGEKVDCILGDLAYKARAGDIKEKFKAYGGALYTADLIEYCS